MPPAFVLSQDQTLRKNYFSSLTLQFVIFFRKEDLWLFWFCTIVQIYCFFTTTFQVLFKTFKIWLGLIARFNFSRNTQTKIKTHLQRKPIYFHQGFRYLQHLFNAARCVSAICYFSSDCYIELAFRELLSFVMLLNVSSFAYLSNTFFKKIQKKFWKMCSLPCLL